MNHSHDTNPPSAASSAAELRPLSKGAHWRRALSAVSLVLGATTGSAATFVAHDIGHLGGGFTRPGAVNGQGHIVGSSVTGASAGGQQAAFSYRNGTMTDIGSALFGKQDSFAAAVSEQGHVVMVSNRAGEDFASSLAYTGANAADGQIVNIGTGVISQRTRNGYGGSVFVNSSGQVAINLYDSEKDKTSPMRVFGSNVESFGRTGSALTAFNEHGAAAGVYSLSSAPDKTRGFLLNAQGELTDAGTFSSVTGQTWLTGLNDEGYAVGSSLFFDGSKGAAIYDPARGEITKLRTSLLPGTRELEADDINNALQVVGRAHLLVDGRYTQHGFLSSAGQMIDLGAGLDDLHINNLGQVLAVKHYEKGQYPSPTDYFDMFLWDDNQMLNLDQLVGGIGITDVVYAFLGDNGHIAGWGTDALGAERAFHLYRLDGGSNSPTPAPGTLMLALLGLVPLLRRRT